MIISDDQVNTLPRNYKGLILIIMLVLPWFIPERLAIRISREVAWRYWRFSEGPQ